ncbi:hypothetical protein [Amycolatopsis sp. CA-230715]|uniref:hypothetical protein n=1 Tax=Amycolatopsis sp. CA-230715 TaxID=2745196 RepID=UPI001C0319B9|nr:hypothetical protein [Amycolatopsis sp. CA-230715]QWF79485.1 hypothetical protein HUW46_02893 [Amycolatopsis sp. CA-230715]
MQSWTKRVVVGALGVLAAATMTTTSGPARGSEVHTPSGPQRSTVEDYAYPGADRIYADRGIRLKSGDGNILLVDCADRTDVLTINTSKGESFCFSIRGPKGYLSLEVHEVFLAKGDGHDIQMTLNAKGRATTVPVTKKKWTKIGEAANPASGPATLIEIKATGTASPR